MLKSSLFATALAAGVLLTTAQGALAAPPPVVSAGGQFQQIPPAPEPERTIPDIRIDRGAKAHDLGPAGPKVQVQSLHVTGETLFPEAELIAVAGFHPGSQLDLRDLREMAARISDFYNRRGYFVAQAYLPAQDIQAGAVTIVVIEGHYGRVGLDNHTNLSNGLAHSILHGLDSGDVVAGAPLERRLLILSDIPGVLVKSTLSPGAEVGTSDLTVALTPGPRFSGSIDADNGGDPNTGAWRLGGTLYVNDPTGHGDLITLRALSSFDGLDYGRAAYQFQVQDATIGVSYAALDYRLHGDFSALRASGTAQVASAYASYPIVRSYDNNLVALTDFDYRTYRDKEDAIFQVTDKDEYALLIGISGDHHDTLGGGGWDQFSLGYTFGDLDIQTPAARLIDASTAHAQGDYGKFTYSVSRLQTVWGPVSVYGLIRGQEASKNLDISEKMELGGAYAVRAYAEGAIYADDGYIATVEARLMLPPLPSPVPGRVQLFGFIDTAQASANHSPWFPGPNHESVSGGGVGLNWTAFNNFVVRATYAHTLGDAEGVPGPIASSRGWIQLVKLF
jgi:hemolysin activation/secretion protein